MRTIWATKGLVDPFVAKLSFVLDLCSHLWWICYGVTLERRSIRNRLEPLEDGCQKCPLTLLPFLAFFTIKVPSYSEYTVPFLTPISLLLLSTVCFLCYKYTDPTLT